MLIADCTASRSLVERIEYCAVLYLQEIPACVAILPSCQLMQARSISYADAAKKGSSVQRPEEALRDFRKSRFSGAADCSAFREKRRRVEL